MREEVEVIEYEAPRSTSPTPPQSPMRASSSTSNLPAVATATPTAHVAAAAAAAASTAATAGSSNASVTSTGSHTTGAPSTRTQQPTHTAVAAAAAANNIHASVNLLDMDDHAAPVASASVNSSTHAAAALPVLTLIECAGRFTPVLFQQMWGRFPEAYAGQICRLARRPGSTAEVEAALRPQKVSAPF